MLERIIDAGEGYKVYQDIMLDNWNENLSLVSTVSDQVRALSDLIICAPGFPGDASSMFHELGKQIAVYESRGTNQEFNTLTTVLGYSGVRDKEIIYPAGSGVGLPGGVFSFRDSVEQLSTVLSELRIEYPKAKIHLIGHSYGGMFAANQMDNSDLSYIVLVNPVISVNLLTASENFNLSGLFEEATKSKISAKLEDLLNEQNLFDFTSPYYDEIYGPLRTNLKVPMFLIRGTRDQYLSADHVKILGEHLFSKNVPFIKSEYDADHDFSEAISRRLMLEDIRNLLKPKLIPGNYDKESNETQTYLF